VHIGCINGAPRRKDCNFEEVRVKVDPIKLKFWIKHRRRELHISPTELKNRIEDFEDQDNENSLSYRTFTKMRGGKDENYKESSLMKLAKILEINFLEMIAQIVHFVIEVDQKDVNNQDALDDQKYSKKGEEVKKSIESTYSNNTNKKNNAIKTEGLLAFLKQSKKQSNFRYLIYFTLLCLSFYLTYLTTRSTEQSNSSIFTVKLLDDQRTISINSTAETPERQVQFADTLFTPIVIKDSDSSIAITAATERKNQLQRNRSEPGILYGINLEKSDFWRYNFYDSVFLTFSSKYTPKLTEYFAIKDIGKDFYFRGGGKEYIWAWAINPFYTASCFAIFDPLNGEIKYAFWSWGRIYKAIITDLNNDGISEVVLSAANNGLTKIVDNDYAKRTQDITGVYLISPEENLIECAPGFYYKPQMPCKTIKWFYLAHHYRKWPFIDIDTHRGQRLVRITMRDLGLYYRINLEGEIISGNGNYEWNKNYGSEIPKLIGIIKEDNRLQLQYRNSVSNSMNYPLNSLYSKDELILINSLLSLEITLDKKNIPTYNMSFPES